MSHLPPKMNEDPRWRHMEDGTPAGSYNSATAEYNIDDPKFCTPMSVLSGLVSGFCERQAVVMTGNTIGGSAWQTAKTAAADAANGNTVQSMTALIALGRDVGSTVAELANVVPSTDANFMMISAGTAGTYMQVFDGLLNLTITSGGYVDVTGATAYDTFAKVATVAVQAAQAAGQPIGTPVSGGLAYSGTMKPTLPTEWALERKWMMEVLRRTPGGAAETGPVQSDVDLWKHYISQVDSVVRNPSAGAADTAVPEMFGSAQWEVATSYYGTDPLYMEDTLITSGGYSVGNRYDITSTGETEVYSRDIYDGEDIVGSEVVKVRTYEENRIQQMSAYNYAYHLDKIVSHVTTQDMPSLPAVTTIPMYLMRQDGNYYTTIDYSNMIPVGAAMHAENGSSYYVVAGGTLYVDVGIGAGTVSIEPNGVVSMTDSTAHIDKLNIMDGGTYNPFMTLNGATSVMYPGVNSAMRNYISVWLADPYGYTGGPYNVIKTGQTAVYAHTPYGLYVSGGTATVNGPFNPLAPRDYVQDAGSSTFVHIENGYADLRGSMCVHGEVCSGGTLRLGSNAEPTRILVCSGGVLIFDGGTDAPSWGGPTVLSGGTLNIVGPMYSYDFILNLFDGATVNVEQNAGCMYGYGNADDTVTYALGFANPSYSYDAATGNGTYIAVMGVENAMDARNLDRTAYHNSIEDVYIYRFNSLDVTQSGGQSLVSGWNTMSATNTNAQSWPAVFNVIGDGTVPEDMPNANAEAGIPVIGGTIQCRTFSRYVVYDYYSSDSVTDTYTSKYVLAPLLDANWTVEDSFAAFYRRCYALRIEEGAEVVAINSAGPGTVDHYADFNLRQSRLASEIPAVTPVDEDEEEEEDEDDD